MLDHLGTGRVYNLDPTKHIEALSLNMKKPEFPNVIFIQFKQGSVDKMTSKEISELFAEHADFIMFKNSRSSCFLEIS